MTMQRNVWRPDTCGCQIVYEWDDAIPQDNRVHTVIDSCISHDGDIIYTTKCTHHAHHPNKEAHYQDVLDENQSKNKAISLLIKNMSKLDGGQNEVKWRFDKERNIILSHPLLTQIDKDVMNVLDKTDIVKRVIFE